METTSIRRSRLSFLMYAALTLIFSASILINVMTELGLLLRILAFSFLLLIMVILFLAARWEITNTYLTRQGNSFVLFPHYGLKPINFKALDVVTLTWPQASTCFIQLVDGKRFSINLADVAKQDRSHLVSLLQEFEMKN